jgi:hypothetical protein
LDSIAIKEINTLTDSALVEVYTEWNSSLGILSKTDSMQLVRQDKRWFILPPKFIPEIPDEQVRSYTYTLFKKQGKRVISSFPTVKDDRIKKPFAAFKQANLIRNGEQNFIVGEILNADDIPINVALKVVVRYGDETYKNFYPTSAFQYNLSPKGSSYFQVDLDDSKTMDSLIIQSVELYAETDVSERGYIHGGTPGYGVEEAANNDVLINARYYNELTADINIPGILIAEKDSTGAIWQSKLSIHPTAVRSGMHIEFTKQFEKIQGQAEMIKTLPLSVFINGQPRSILPFKPDEIANRNHGIAVLPHCFISQEIYLQ